MSTFDKKWIEEGFGQEAIKKMEELAKQLTQDKKSALSTSKLRKFFGEIKRIELLIKADGFEKHQMEVLMLGPKVAYDLGRDEKSGKSSTLEMYYEVFSKMLQSVTNEKSFKHFVLLQEALVAYHKYYYSTATSN